MESWYMMKKQKSCSLQTDTLGTEIIEESKKWVNENKSCLAKGNYTSPRISSEISDCSMPMTFDQYSHCSLGCLYCFAYFFKSNNPSKKNSNAQQLKAIDAKRMIENMQGKGKSKQSQLMYEHFYKKKFLLHWGGLADPFCMFEKKNMVGLKLIESLGEMNYPTLFSFKGDTILQKDYKNVFQRYSKQNNFAFQISIITNSDELSSKVEIGVPSTTERLKMIEMLSGMGYWTILRLRPFIVGVSDEGLDELLQRALKAGINGVSMEFFALDARANVGMKKRYDWLAKQIGVKNIMKYFSDLSPSERGGYMRLNRLVKEEYVKKVYTFCAKHGLTCGISDPDFKELNTSGSCCAMPDDFKKNKGLENWTRDQLTYHLKQARKNYHITGEPQRLFFNEVYTDNSGYLNSGVLANDHVYSIGEIQASRNILTLKMILQEQWNNLRSPACPCNYLHGKVLPTGKDDKGNIIFTYNPMPYEKTWKKEGVDLTR
jgi:DNA repair photolyase